MVPAPVAGPVVDAHAWLEIDRATLVANARALARKVSPASLCAVVKANAYGHGLTVVAQTLASAGIDDLRFGVFSASEAFALRDAGVAQPVVALGPVADADLERAASQRVELAVLDESMGEPFARRGIRAHVKVDTGLNRFGISLDRAPAALGRFRDLGLNVVGLYSHLANAEDIDKPFTMQQVGALRGVAKANLAAPYFTNATLHIASSAAAMMWADTRLDMVRCGIALYGAWPSAQVQAIMAGDDPSFELRPALHWYAPIAQIRNVAKGQSAGYGRAFVAQRDSRIALLPVGYADGVPRAAGSGRLVVQLAGGSAPTAGRICMNACMLDISDIAAPIAVGDRVALDIEALARAAGTLNYEILARLPLHLERRYT